MLRLLHTADVHLGARHGDLGEQAAAQRERQFAAFRATVDLSLAEKVDLVLIAGDLFDTNTQPRRSVERVAAELKRLAAATIRTVIIPGTHDVYDRSSIYRAHDLAALAGVAADSDLVVVLTPDRPEVEYPILDAIVYGRVFATKRAPRSPLDGFTAALPERRTWRIGLVHGSVLIAGRTEHDEVVVSTQEIAKSGLDYLALGHWHSSQQGRAGATTWAYAGAPEPVAVDQDRAGKVLLVSLDVDARGARSVTVEERQVGRTRFQRLDVDAATIETQPALIERLSGLADPDVVLDVRITGVKPDELDLDVDEVEAALAPAVLKIRVRDVSVAALSSGALPPEDTILGAFIRDTEASIAELEAADRDAEAAEIRDVLRLGRLLLTGHEVTL
ncbi:MAG: DNA repair exonuclease [Chloroflexi bacterium]|nr:DNA repair exonuclease [Chloroflexota bacterium]